MAGQNTSGAPATAEHSAPKRKPKSLMVQRISYAFGNLGQAAYYNALSTYFVTYYAAQTLFSSYEKDEAAAMIGIITFLVFIIRIGYRWCHFIDSPFCDFHRSLWSGEHRQDPVYHRLHHRLHPSGCSLLPA